MTATLLEVCDALYGHGLHAERKVVRDTVDTIDALRAENDALRAARQYIASVQGRRAAVRCAGCSLSVSRRLSGPTGRTTFGQRVGIQRGFEP